MQQYIAALGVALAVLLGRPAMAQTFSMLAGPHPRSLSFAPPRSLGPQAPAAGEADPGIRPTRLIDRAEVRVSRVAIAPGAVRRVHTHDDVEYHLWVPIEGMLEITIGNEAPVAAASGQAFFMKRGTPHGFRNVGTTPGAALEIFVKQTKTADGRDPLGAPALGLAALRKE